MDLEKFTIALCFISRQRGRRWALTHIQMKSTHLKDMHALYGYQSPQLYSEYSSLE